MRDKFIDYESEREDPLDYAEEARKGDPALTLLFIVCVTVACALIVLLTGAAMIDSAMVKP